MLSHANEARDVEACCDAERKGEVDDARTED